MIDFVDRYEYYRRMMLRHRIQAEPHLTTLEKFREQYETLKDDNRNLRKFIFVKNHIKEATKNLRKIQITLEYLYDRCSREYFKGMKEGFLTNMYDIDYTTLQEYVEF